MNKKIEQWIIEADIMSMQKAMECGETTSEQLVLIYLARIEQYDKELKSVLEINPDAVAIARALDYERNERGSRGRLHGIPLLLKDNIGTHDRTHTSAGSIALADWTPPEDSFLASKLRKAGAVLLGKTNMTEWANFMSPTMWAGYSSRGGLTLNPYGPGKLFVGGSSSGSASAVAANLVAGAIGTETSGSIISPSSQNCIVGIKPTVGLVSRSGIIPASVSQDTAGPMARTVSDAAIILGAMTGVDASDSATEASRDRYFQDYTSFLITDGLKDARIGIPRGYYRDLDEAGLAIMEAAIAVLRDRGATIIDPVKLPCEDEDASSNILQYEFKRVLNDYLSGLDATMPVHNLREVIQYNELHSDRALKYGKGTLEQLEKTSDSITDEVYAEQLDKSRGRARNRGIDYVIEQHGLDALLFAGNHGTDVAAKAGYPLITVPAGYAATGVVAPGGYITNGPHGVTFSGTAFSEPTLIKLAYGFEQATKIRFPPDLS
nr:amidase family protein [Cohnella herbarum]